MSAAMVLFLLGTQECVRNSRGKRVIGLQATEVLLYNVVRFSPHHGPCDILCSLPLFQNYVHLHEFLFASSNDVAL